MLEVYATLKKQARKGTNISEVEEIGRDPETKRPRYGGVYTHEYPPFSSLSVKAPCPLQPGDRVVVDAATAMPLRVVRGDDVVWAADGN